jgi:hypothetical protein
MKLIEEILTARQRLSSLFEEWIFECMTSMHTTGDNLCMA